MNSIRPLIVGLAGAATMAFASCSTTNSDNPDYVTYPSDGDYGTYGSNTGGGAYATDTGVGGGGAYPTSPQNNYGNDYGSDYGSTGTSNTGGGAASSSQTHTVQRGETLYRISRNYGTTVANIKAANGLTSDLIHPGDVLVVR